MSRTYKEHHPTARNPEVKKISLSDARKQGYKACKRCRKNQRSLQ